MTTKKSVRIDVEVVSDRCRTLEFKDISTGETLYWFYTNRPKIGEYYAGMITTIEAIRESGSGLSRVKRVD